MTLGKTTYNNLFDCGFNLHQTPFQQDFKTTNTNIIADVCAFLVIMSPIILIYFWSLPYPSIQMRFLLCPNSQGGLRCSRMLHYFGRFLWEVVVLIRTLNILAELQSPP